MKHAILFLQGEASESSFDLQKFLEGQTFWDFLSAVGLAVLVWVVGSFVINKAVGLLKNVMEKRKIDPSLRPFLISLINATLKIMLLLAVASTLGMNVTSFVGILSAAAFAVGLALQGGLSNFAGGVMIMIFKPFKVGDLITTQGFTGTVKEIQIFNTLLVTLDNEIIIIPNGPVSNGPITNYSKEGKRGVTMSFGIGYGDNIDLAKQIVMDVAATCEQIIDLDKSASAIGSLGDSSVNVAVRLWAKPEDYFAVMFYMNEQVKKAFDEKGIGIPYQTLDVNITNQG